MQSLAPGDRHARRRSWCRPTAFPPARRVALPSPTPRWRDRGRLGGFQAVSRKLGERRWSTAPAAWEADCRPQHIPGPATSRTARVPGCCDAGAPLLGSGGAAPSSLRPPLAVLGEILGGQSVSKTWPWNSPSRPPLPTRRRERADLERPGANPSSTCTWGAPGQPALSKRRLRALTAQHSHRGLGLQRDQNLSPDARRLGCPKRACLLAQAKGGTGWAAPPPEWQRDPRAQGGDLRLFEGRSEWD